MFTLEFRIFQTIQRDPAGWATLMTMMILETAMTGRSMRSSEAEELWEAAPKLLGLSGQKLCDLLHVLGAARAFRYHRRVAEEVAKSLVISRNECLGPLGQGFWMENMELENPSYGNFESGTYMGTL